MEKLSLYMKLYCIQAEKGGGFTISKVTFIVLSRQADLQLARLGCHSWGSLGREGQFAVPALLSTAPACLGSSLHMFLVSLGGASVLPVLGLVVSGWNINSKHSPCPHTCSSLLCHTHRTFTFGPRKFPILFYALFHMCFSLLFAFSLRGPV